MDTMKPGKCHETVWAGHMTQMSVLTQYFFVACHPLLVEVVALGH